VACETRRVRVLCIPLCLFAALVTLGCAVSEPTPTSPEFASPNGGKADGAGISDDSSAAPAILDLVNGLELDELVDDVGIRRDAAEAIVAARVGDDGRLGTDDDESIASMRALLAVRGVGPMTVRTLLRHADMQGLVPQWLLRRPGAPRVVAIGDVHGDLEAARSALLLVGAIDDEDRWVGGDLVVVQVGDVLDRGDGELALLELFSRLTREASEAGGALIRLLGNHEIMNLVGDFRYVTGVGFSDFAGYAIGADEAYLEDFEPPQRGRAAAFRRGGPLAEELADQNVTVIVGDTLFVHGGLLPGPVGDGLELINHEARAFVLWEDVELPAVLDSEDGPVWYRGYGEDETVDCDILAETLERANARRMVIGHTVQEGGITSACDERLFRVDVGLSAHYGGDVEALEISGDAASVLYW